MMIGRLDARGEESRAVEEVLEAHQRADALVQRMLVSNHDKGSIMRCVKPHFAPSLGDATGCARAIRGKYPVSLVELGHGASERGKWPRIVDHVVGASEAVLARKLCRHDRADLGRGEPAARSD